MSFRQSKYSEIRNIPQRSTANDATVKAAPVKDDSRASGSGQELPGISTSKIDVNAIPVHKGTGKPITQLNIDEGSCVSLMPTRGVEPIAMRDLLASPRTNLFLLPDLKENEKPWRQPGTDISDYFNYGFDEFTWALYADKQERLRGEYNQDSIAQGQKKMMEDMMMMMGMPGLPGANGSGAGAGASQMPAGFDGMTPEMQAMMQQMMMGGGGGMDGQMDPSAMAAMFAGMQNGGGGGGGAQGGQGQNFQGGFAGAQGQGYGYDQQMAGAGAGGGGGSRGNFGGGRGRGGRRNW